MEKWNRRQISGEKGQNLSKADIEQHKGFKI